MNDPKRTTNQVPFKTTSVTTPNNPAQAPNAASSSVTTTNSQSKLASTPENDSSDNINTRIQGKDELSTLYGNPTNPITLTNSQGQVTFPKEAYQDQVSSSASILSVLNFPTTINDSMLRSTPRCNNVSQDELVAALNRAVVFITAQNPDNPSISHSTILTAIAWHIAEFRPTPVTHGMILDVPAQDVYTNMIGSNRHITIRRITRTWSRSISAVLAYHAHLEEPIFTTQCNDTFVNIYDKIAVAPFFFDGVDTSTIPPSVSRIIATGLAYSKRSQSNSPFSFHNRPTFVRNQSEDYNGSLQFTGVL